MRRIAALSLLAVLSLSAPARADDLFGLAVNGTTNTVKAGGSSVLNLVTDLSRNQQQFSVFANQNYNASLNYAGISNAVKFNQSFDTAGHRIVNLTVPSVGLNKTFSSANGDLGTQLKDFLKKEGLADLGQFQAIVDKTSIAGVVDGNPMAATALLADAGYQQFALHTHPGGGSDDSSFGGHGQSWYTLNGGFVDAGGISGKYVNFDIGTEYHFNDHIGLALDAPGRWLSLRSANVFMGGLVLGLPITILEGEEPGNGLSWQITPAGHAALVGSADFVSGGLIYGGQVDNSINYTIDGYTFTLASEAGYFHGASVDIAGYDFNTEANQWVFKNGLQVTKSWGHFFLDASGTWTNFLHDTFVDGYFSPQAGLGFHWGKNNGSGIRIAYEGNFGDNYSTNGGSILLFFRD